MKVLRKTKYLSSIRKTKTKYFSIGIEKAERPPGVPCFFVSVGTRFIASYRVGWARITLWPPLRSLCPPLRSLCRLHCVALRHTLPAPLHCVPLDIRSLPHGCLLLLCRPGLIAILRQLDLLVCMCHLLNHALSHK